MTNQNASIMAELETAQKELATIRKKVTDLRRQLQDDSIKDYNLQDGNGNKVALSSLFGDKSDLIVVHNMGQGCSYCTLWADGFNGLHEHLSDRAGFVVVSADAPEKMKKFAASRNWKFNILSGSGSSFAADMGYMTEKGDPWPGISTFHKSADGSMKRITHAMLGPGDDFCSLWHIFDMLKDGANNWEPKYKY